MTDLSNLELISDERVLAELAGLAFAGLEDSGLKPGEKLRALEMLGRHLGLFRERRDKAADSPLSIQWEQE